MNKKFARAKTWIAEHRFELAYVTIITASIAATAGLSYLSIKEEEAAMAAQRKLRDWIISENSKGRTVVRLADGDYLSYVPEVA